MPLKRQPPKEGASVAVWWVSAPEMDSETIFFLAVPLGPTYIFQVPGEGYPAATQQ